MAYSAHGERVMAYCFAKLRPQEYLCPSYGLRGKTRVWKSGRSVAETRTRSVFWVYMTYGDLVMAALSCWRLICDI